jgi:hypothetical protein
MAAVSPLPQAREIEKMCQKLDDVAHGIERGTTAGAHLDYVALLDRHGRRRRSFE